MTGELLQRAIVDQGETTVVGHEEQGIEGSVAENWSCCSAGEGGPSFVGSFRRCGKWSGSDAGRTADLSWTGLDFGFDYVERVTD
jgi:hypothetical protein